MSPANPTSTSPDAERLGRDLPALAWNADGLVPAVVQDAGTGRVLMLAWMNAEALTATLTTRRGTYFSRSRQRLWVKGETSGHVQHVRRLEADCDGDTLLLSVDQTGPACHTGAPSCFDTAVLLEEGERA